MIPTVVESVRVSLVTQHRVVLLKEAAGARRLPVWIGAYEAEAIALAQQGMVAPRPLPHDLLLALIGGLGGAVDRVLVAGLAEDVFYARVVVRQRGRSVELDARPSDAIALAVRAGVPILVDEAVMERAGVALGEDDDPEDAPPGGPRAGDEPPAAFRDFIGTLDLDDLGGDRGA